MLAKLWLSKYLNESFVGYDKRNDDVWNKLTGVVFVQIDRRLGDVIEREISDEVEKFLGMSIYFS